MFDLPTLPMVGFIKVGNLALHQLIHKISEICNYPVPYICILNQSFAVPIHRRRCA